MELSIVIISFNTKQLLKNCLDSIKSSSDTLKKEVIVVDNNSTDGSLEMLKDDYPEVKRIANTENTGFTVANNQGVEQSSGEYILLLNSDTIVKTNALNELVGAAKTKAIDIATCKLLNPDGSIQPQGGALPNLIHLMIWMWFLDDIPVLGSLIPSYQNQQEWRFDHHHTPGWVGGTALLVKKSVYEKLGGLDEAIFMYGEDVDFCLRARKQGYGIHYFPTPEIIHLGQGSGNKEKSILGEYRGILHLYKKHYPAWQFPLVKFVLKSGALLRLIIFGIILGDNEKRHIYQQALVLD